MDLSRDSLEKIREKAKAIPFSPGVYFFKDARGKVIYVGKAARLRSRVRNYLQDPEGMDPKTRALMESADAVDYIVTGSEVEALVLEASLVREYRPRYNIRLKDDKRYPYLKLTVNEEFPRLLLVRRVEMDGAEYYGPYTDAGAVRKTMRLIKRIFPLRNCAGPEPPAGERECLNYQIGRCLAPCTGRTDEQAYGEVVEQVRMFLRGHNAKLVDGLRKKMSALSEHRRYEEASHVRDQIRALGRISERQHAVDPRGGDEDVLAVSREGERACGVVLRIREGRILGSESFVFRADVNDDIGVVYEEFLKQYYSKTGNFPGTILLQHGLAEADLISEWLEGLADTRIELRRPRRGHRRRLVELAEKNAASRLLTQDREDQRDLAVLGELKKALDLPVTPRLIEAYDISNIQGAGAAGSMVTFRDGKPLKSGYRHYRIRGVDGIDDYAMMKEVLGRRFGSIESGKSVKPDLILVDGGRGHVGTALSAMEEASISPVPVAGLAKRNEEVFLPGRSDPLVLPARSGALKLLQRIRNEAHRFAVEYHRDMRSRDIELSGIDRIPGVGKKRKIQLLVRFGSLDAIRSASVEEISSIEGIGEKTAERIYGHIHGQE